MRSWLRKAALTAVIMMCATNVLGADLVIQLTGIEQSRGGSIKVAVYREAKGFESYDPQSTFATFSRQLITAANNQEGSTENQQTIAFSLNDVPPGQYAIHSYHDANNNQQFDSDGSMPLEGWGISRARHMWQSPNFEKAAYEIGSKSAVITVKTFYAK